MNWQPSYDQCGSWAWSSPDLANGWTVRVGDSSQSCTPPRPTLYVAYAVCRWWIVTHHTAFATLEEAKSVALGLALEQGQASSDPGCRREARAACQ